MALERSESSSVSAAAPPPLRTLNAKQFAESRAPELESLHAIVASRLDHNFRIRRGKRRRTTGHMVSRSRRRKRRRVGDGGKPENGEKKFSRRARRRKQLQENPVTGFCVSGDGTKRLRTHLWHAKRFTMVKRWGFYLPLGLHGGGRGSRAVLKSLKSGALVHDSSYCCPILLEGPEESIVAVLMMVLLPSPSCDTDELSKVVMSGVCFRNAMLYHVGTHLYQLIAPVLYMWRPLNRGSFHINDGQDRVPNGCSISHKSECSIPSSRQLWIWIHAAAFDEGFDCLRSACQKQMDGGGASISCLALEGHLAKLEIIGSKASEIINKILHPVAESDHQVSSCSASAACFTSEIKRALICAKAEDLPPHSVLSLTVHDPRDLPSSGTESILGAPSAGVERDLQEDDILHSNDPLSGKSARCEEILTTLLSEPESYGNHFSDSESLWDSSHKLNPPIKDDILCTKKHLGRLKSFCLDHSDNTTPVFDVRDVALQSCPILLLKHKEPGNHSIRWSVILPLSWTKIFWASLISHGAHAIGLRERQWIACSNGLPSFPFDFPDCKTYSFYMAAECAQSDRQSELRPPAARPSRVPIPPPWDCITSSIKRGSSIVEDNQALGVQKPGREAAPVNLLENSDPGMLEPLTSENAAPSFHCSVQRSSDALSSYMEKRADRHLLLFPNSATWEENSFNLNEISRFHGPITWPNLMHADRELCLVRVLLHAYREGSFEGGAVVCAPVSADLANWTSRFEEESLQIPQSFVRTYFLQRDTGKWELHLPEDDLTWQKYRWPIGFVTSGFVRGSSKPVAVAFCEVNLLALLRSQQWSYTKKVRPEIYVLVRNLKSSAYRRALATIVLEQGREDVEFM